MKTITVRGIGNISLKADYINLLLTINAQDKDYEKSLFLANNKIKSLEEAISSVGFNKEDLKTLNYNVCTNYESVKDDNGNYINEFAGYNCSYSLKLAFDFDNNTLTKTLSAISTSNTQPEINISFTIKDTSKADEQLLISATNNAKEKAMILANSSNSKLGELQAISYGLNEHNYNSNTSIDYVQNNMPLMARGKLASLQIEPEDIVLKDSVSFVWELL